MRRILLLTTLALAGCTHYYTKPGAGTEEGSRAVAWCQMHAPPIGQPFIDNCMRSQGWVQASH